MPESIFRRLLIDEEFVALSKISTVNYGKFGSFQHDDILKALVKIRSSGGQVELIANNGTHSILESSAKGISFLSADGSGHAQLICELSFLDPERNVRLEALNNIIAQAWPSLPRSNKWLQTLFDRPLSEFELAQLISDIRETPSHFLNVIKRKWDSGESIDTASIFPTSFAYYEALVGPPTDGLAAVDWVENILTPHIKKLLSRSLIDGLRYLLALNIDPKLSPVSLVSDIPADQLLSALKGLMDTYSPLAMLSLLEIALSRTKGNDEFSTFASDMLDRLLGEKLVKSAISSTWLLMPVLVRTSLRHIRVNEDLLHTPPYWRRLAAFAHASSLVEMLEVDSENIVKFGEWLDGLETRADATSTLLEIRKGSLWTESSLSPLNFKTMIINRLILCRDELVSRGVVFPNGHLLDSSVSILKSDGGLLDVKMPSPLLDGIKMKDMSECDKSDSESVSKYFLEAVANLAREPSGVAWNFLAKTCRLIRFDGAMLNELAKIPAQMTLGNESKDRVS